MHSGELVLVLALLQARSASAAPQALDSTGSAPAASTKDAPLAGFTGDTAFLRSADNNYVLFPNGRLQMDLYDTHGNNAKQPNTTYLLKRARVELAGWVGEWFFFNIAGDFASGVPDAKATPAAQSQLNATDDFVGIAPFGEWAMLQVGQFDAPFTLENRTSDKYFDFMERSMAVRAFGIPTNKEQGAMVHGIHPQKLFYYSLGLFNGDGQNFKNVDNRFDLMGRAWVAPMALAGAPGLSRMTLGGSFWTGNHQSSLALPKQTTQAGYTFLNPSWTAPSSSGTATELRQNDAQRSWALELNAPITNRIGLRGELLHKHQNLAAMDITDASKPVLTEPMLLEGWAGYGQAWVWLVGDDSILPDPGLQLPGRWKGFSTRAPRHGLMLTARLDFINETLSSRGADITRADLLGSLKATAIEGGLNYWYGKRFRATANYVQNRFAGGSAQAGKLKTEHELGLRLAVAL